MGRTKSLTLSLLASSAVLVSGSSIAQETDMAQKAPTKLEQSVPAETADPTMIEDALETPDQSAVSSTIDQMSDMANQAADPLIEQTSEVADQDVNVGNTSPNDASAEDTSADNAEQEMVPADPTTPMVDETTSMAAPDQPLTEPVLLEQVEAMQTEEQYADGYVNYKAAPDAAALETLFEQEMLEFDTEVNLAVRLNRIEKEIAKCQAVRNDVEKIIGDRPGSYSVDIGWVKVYQNCLVQRRNEMDRLLKKVNQLQADVVTAAGDDGASKQWDMIARVNARYSEVRLHLNSEFKRQAEFVEYYNTGVMIYEDDTPARKRRWPWQRNK